MKHDTSLPAQAPPLFTRIRCTFILNFSTLYISYIFPVEIQTVLAPVSFLSHIKIQGKSHIIKRHNRCESSKRERKQKKTKNYSWSSLANVLYISVFTLQPDGESTESLPVSDAWLIGHFQGRSATRQSLQNIPFIVPFPSQGDKDGRT